MTPRLIILGLGAALALPLSLSLAPSAARAATPAPDPGGDYCASQISSNGQMGTPVCFDTSDTLGSYLVDFLGFNAASTPCRRVGQGRLKPLASATRLALADPAAAGRGRAPL